MIHAVDINVIFIPKGNFHDTPDIGDSNNGHHLNLSLSNTFENETVTLTWKLS